MSFASRWKGIGRPASGGATLNWKPPRRPHKRPPKKGLQNGVRDRNRHRDRSAPRHGRRRRVGPRGHRDGCAPHGDACGGPRRGTTTQRRYLGPCRPDVTLRLRAVGALRRPAWQELRERAGASEAWSAPTTTASCAKRASVRVTGCWVWRVVRSLCGRAAHGRTWSSRRSQTNHWRQRYTLGWMVQVCQCAKRSW